MSPQQIQQTEQAPQTTLDRSAETFVALKCEIDNWRWAGVPFLIRAG